MQAGLVAFLPPGWLYPWDHAQGLPPGCLPVPVVFGPASFRGYAAYTVPRPQGEIKISDGRIMTLLHVRLNFAQGVSVFLRGGLFHRKKGDAGSGSSGRRSTP